MDKDHHLDAPDNESLRTIEQLSDHSELTNIYPHPHDQWEGTELMSSEEREKKRDREQLNISLSIRRWFFLVGLLIPIPFVLGVLLAVVGITFMRPENFGVLLLPAVIALVVWFIASRLALKKVVSIFYGHAIATPPYFIVHIGLLLLSIQGIYVAASSFYTQSLLYDTVLTSGFVMLMSIFLSAVLLVLWTSPLLSSRLKFTSIGVIAVAILGATAIVNFL